MELYKGSVNVYLFFITEESASYQKITENGSNKNTMDTVFYCQRCKSPCPPCELGNFIPNPPEYFPEGVVTCKHGVNYSPVLFFCILS